MNEYKEISFADTHALIKIREMGSEVAKWALESPALGRSLQAHLEVCTENCSDIKQELYGSGEIEIASPIEVLDSEEHSIIGHYAKLPDNYSLD